jgi:hypothetical protein
MLMHPSSFPASSNFDFISADTAIYLLGTDSYTIFWLALIVKLLILLNHPAKNNNYENIFVQIFEIFFEILTLDNEWTPHL